MKTGDILYRITIHIEECKIDVFNFIKETPKTYKLEAEDIFYGRYAETLKVTLRKCDLNKYTLKQQTQENRAMRYIGFYRSPIKAYSDAQKIIKKLKDEVEEKIKNKFTVSDSLRYHLSDNELKE